MRAISAPASIRRCVARVKAADLLLLVGGRFGEMPSQGYTLLDIPNPKTKFVHVYPDPDEFGRVYRPDLAINAAPTAFAAALKACSRQTKSAGARWTKAGARRISGVDRAADQECRARSTSARSWCGCAGSCRPRRSSPTARAISRPGCIASIASRKFATLLGPTSGSMGYGLPAAVGAKRLYPDRPSYALRATAISDERAGVRDRRSIRICRSSC